MVREGKLNKFERNMKKIMSVLPSKDSIGTYFTFCDYHQHPGIIGELKAEKCHRRQCTHLKVYRK